MFWIMLFFGWKLANTLERIGDELIAMGRVEMEPEEDRVEVDTGPQADGIWIDPDAVFNPRFRRN